MLNSSKIIHLPILPFPELLRCGRAECGQGYRHKPSRYRSIEIIYCVRGNLPMSQGDISYDISPKQHLILIPEVAFFGHDEAKPNTSFIWLHFTHPSFRVDCTIDDIDSETPSSQTGIRTILSIPQYSTHHNWEPIESLLDELLVWEQRTVSSRLRQQVIFERLLLQLSMPLSNRSGTRIDEHHIQLATHGHRLLEQHMANIKSARLFLADELKYSADYIDRVFKQVFGRSSAMVLNEIRLRQAKVLLQTSNLPIKVIAATICYNDPHYFARFFKNQTNMTPTEYRIGHQYPD